MSHAEDDAGEHRAPPHRLCAAPDSGQPVSAHLQRGGFHRHRQIRGGKRAGGGQRGEPGDDDYDSRRIGREHRRVGADEPVLRRGRRGRAAPRGRHDDRFRRRRVGRRVSARLAAEWTGAAADARAERNSGDGDTLFAGDLRRIPVHVPIQHSGGGAPERRRQQNAGDLSGAGERDERGA